MALLDFSKPLILEADASGHGIGAVLMQGGKLIAFFSKTLGPRDVTYSTYDKEAIVIIEALKNGNIILLVHQSLLELISKA